jgi:hypothetical protein
VDDCHALPEVLANELPTRARRRSRSCSSPLANQRRVGVIEADADAVGEINSLIIGNARNQIYAHDHEFKFKNETGELRSGATLEQDRRFLGAGQKG